LKKALIIAAFTFLSIYIIAASLLYVKQEDMLFLAQPLPENYQFKKGNEIKISVDENINLSCVYIQNEHPKGVVLYLHGNKGNNKRCLYQAEQFIVDGQDLLMPDYRGYGKSDGIIASEEQLLDDVQKVYDFVKQIYGEENITIAAYSLGTGMATYLASHNKPKELFLVSPYLSIVDLKDKMFIPVPDFLVKYPLNTLAYMEKINCPITIFHGTADELIPYSSSEILKRNFPDKVSFHSLDGATHRSSIFANKVHQVFRLAFL
jgi:pimeloyl-ACP methyl ester carboxylesterase